MRIDLEGFREVYLSAYGVGIAVLGPLDDGHDLEDLEDFDVELRERLGHVLEEDGGSGLPRTLGETLDGRKAVVLRAVGTYFDLDDLDEFDAGERESMTLSELAREAGVILLEKP